MKIGLTGSWGTGKTTVAGMFKRLGAKVIDADKIAHRLIQPHTLIYQKLISVFGKKILKKNCTAIDRKKLARIVFSKKTFLTKLNKIIHPEVIRTIKERIKKDKSKIIILDAPLLIETGLDEIVDKLIVVKTSRDKQINRLKEKTGLSKKEISKRISYQLPLSYKIKKADFVIDNNGRREDTFVQVRQIWDKLS
ncbi:MAG: dephospho-CoA kinase [Candidatus Omnitrophica bacterium]|nr:dephospho-CoA kinase [Candidatus Omnitrophota bacterium]